MGERGSIPGRIPEKSSDSVNEALALLPIVARGHADYRLEKPAEMGNVSEPPGIGDVADLTVSLGRIGKSGLALFDPPAE